MRIGIIRARWNDEAVTSLCKGCVQALKDCKVAEESIFETTVPGSFELPLAARFLALSGTVDAIICVGVLIKGETMHFEYISDAVVKGLMNIGIQTNTPVVLGVLTCLNDKQVKARSTGNGYDWGKTAVEMALLRTEAMGGKASDTTTLKELGFGGEPTDKAGKKKASTAFF
jgi:6,7-dimethyl-8-ribityllumazine synthase